MVRMTPALFDRRKRMLDFYYTGLPINKIIHIIAEEEESNFDTIKHDWQKREEWEPLIWKAKSATEDGKNLLYQLAIVREKALALATTSRSDNAKVGALRTVIEATTKEIELRQGMGYLPKQPDKAELSITGELLPFMSDPNYIKAMEQIREKLGKEKDAKTPDSTTEP